MTKRTYFGHTNIQAHEFQRDALEDVLRDVSTHVMEHDNNVPLTVNVYFDTEDELWSVVLVEDADFLG